MPPQEACSVHRRGRLRHLIRGVLLRHPERGPHVVRCDNGVTPEHQSVLCPVICIAIASGTVWASGE